MRRILSVLCAVLVSVTMIFCKPIPRVQASSAAVGYTAYEIISLIMAVCGGGVLKASQGLVGGNVAYDPAQMYTGMNIYQNGLGDILRSYVQRGSYLNAGSILRINESDFEAFKEYFQHNDVATVYDTVQVDQQNLNSVLTEFAGFNPGVQAAQYNFVRDTNDCLAVQFGELDINTWAEFLAHVHTMYPGVNTYWFDESMFATPILQLDQYNRRGERVTYWVFGYQTYTYTNNTVSAYFNSLGTRNTAYVYEGQPYLLNIMTTDNFTFRDASEVKSSRNLILTSNNGLQRSGNAISIGSQNYCTWGNTWGQFVNGASWDATANVKIMPIRAEIGAKYNSAVYDVSKLGKLENISKTRKYNAQTGEYEGDVSISMPQQAVLDQVLADPDAASIYDAINAYPADTRDNSMVLNPSVPATDFVVPEITINPSIAFPGIDGMAGEYTMDLTSFFPFCIPFDIVAFIQLFEADAQAPSVTYPFPYVTSSGQIATVDQTISLSQFDGVAALVRRLELIAFIIGLAVVTRSWFLRG